MDFYHDQGAYLVRLFGNPEGQELPEFVKTSGYDEEADISVLPATSFADPANRLFPVHTPADTYISAAYYYGKTAGRSAEYQDRVADACSWFGIDPAFNRNIETEIQKAAQIFGITDWVSKVKDITDAAKPMPKLGEAEDLWQIDVPGLTARGKTPEALEAVANDFLAKYAIYSPDERENAAAAILETATAIGADIPDQIYSFAKIGGCDRQVLKAALDQRINFIADDRVKRAMGTQVTELFGDNGEPTADEQEKLAQMLLDFDDQHGLTRRYGRGVIEPHLAVWSLQPAAKTATLAIGDREYVAESIKDALPRAIEFVTGKPCKKVAEALASLSEVEARDLNAILSR